MLFLKLHIVGILLSAFNFFVFSPQEPNDSTYIQTGTASFYAKKFNGRKTASGERFHNDSLMAAHKTLPLGTMVRVTNLKNDSVVVVKINDRLPKHSKRSIDLSQKAAKQLNFMKAGLTKVKIEVIEP